jgi:biopolymer transport protein ExbB
MNETLIHPPSLLPSGPTTADMALNTLLPVNPYGIEALWAQGDGVIKSVALLLLLMSMASWYVIVSRSLHGLRLRHAAKRADRFWHAQTIKDGMEAMGGTTATNPFRRLVEDGIHARDHHVARKEELHGQLSLTEWLTGCLRASMDESTERMQQGLWILASIGSTAPFVGLFGTVWGIYHALVGIGVSGQASIDKVAGPVGEALIMTAFGLAVAIPAVLGYNMLVRSNKGVRGQLNRFAHHLHAFLVTGAPVSAPGRQRGHTGPEAS